LHTGDWHPGVIAAAAELAGSGLPALPAIAPSGSSRPLLAWLADRFGSGQIPVCLGAADSVLGVFGLGARQPGQIGYVAGTSSVILGVTDRLVLDPAHRYFVTPMAREGQWGLEMDLLATGDAVSWLSSVVRGGGITSRGREADLVAEATGIDPRNAPIVLPYLSPGEQGALWDERLAGTVVGLHLGHGPAHLARGLLNGIILESGRCLEVLDGVGGFGRELRVGGTSASHPVFLADLASATGRDVTVPSGADAAYSAIGAAQFAALSLDGVEPASAGSTRVYPSRDQAQEAIWHKLWLDFERARLTITAFYHDDDQPGSR
jgi:sugar (pentulose or hexulose) kinase